MREVTPKELQKLNAKSFKETQRYFRRRLREIAAGGDKETTYNPNNYACGDQIKPWLEDLGFTVKQTNPFWCKITWPEGEDIIERLRKESFKILTQPMPAKVHYAIGWLNAEYGTWTRDVIAHDYECSKCGKHAEYVSDYCPNCGKKMIVEKVDRRYDS